MNLLDEPRDLLISCKEQENSLQFSPERYQETFGALSQYALNKKRHKQLSREIYLTTEAKSLIPHSDHEAPSPYERFEGEDSNPGALDDAMSQHSKTDVPDDLVHNAYDCSKYQALQLFCPNKPTRRYPVKYVFEPDHNYRTSD